MSDDQEVPEGPAEAEAKPDEPAAAEDSQEREEEKEAHDESEEENEEPSFFEGIVAEEQERRWRWESLRSLFGTPAATAHRDLIGQTSNRVSGGGSMYQIGGDFVFQPSGAERPNVAYLSCRDVDERLEPVVPPPSMTRLSQVIGRHPVVFLYGPEGTGRAVTALAALLHWVRAAPGFPGEEKERIGVIRGSGAEGRSLLSELRRGHAYLLDDTHGDWVRDLDHLRDLVMRTASRLVVLVSGRRASPPGVVVTHQPPAAIDVFNRWLEYEGRKADVEPRLPAEFVKEVAEDLHDEHSPQRAVDHALEIIHGIEEGRSPEEMLEELPKRLGDHIRSRLDQCQPIAGRCFMAAAAILHDRPEATVSDAALALIEHIHEVWHIKEEDRPAPMWEQLGSWLEYAGATAHPSMLAGGGRVVRLKRRRAPSETIRVLWEEHATIREPLLRWLKDLSEHSDHAVRINAAHTIGKLATLDFALIEERFLIHWSGSRRSMDHWLAALALEATSQEPRMAFRVRSHLRALAASDNYGPRAVAVDAYGTSLGVNAIGEALRVLRRISMPLSMRLNNKAAGSIDYLYSARSAPVVVKELASWVDAGSRGGRYTAALAFVRLAHQARGLPDRPLLTDLDLPDQLVLLWRNALGLKLVRRGSTRPGPAVPAAWDVMEAWMTRYDEKPVSAVVDRVIAAVDPFAARLYLSLWRRREVISKDLYSHLIRLVQEG